MLAFAAAALSVLVDQTAEIDATIKQLYSVISGPAGKKRDWEAFRSLFAAEARMRVVIKRGETSALATLTPDDYVTRSGSRIEETGFFEREISRKTLTYGGLVHVWSTYEARLKEDDAKPFDRGINSIQLVKVDTAWKIVSLAWTSESTAGPIPREFLPSAGQSSPMIP